MYAVKKASAYIYIHEMMKASQHILLRFWSHRKTLRQKCSLPSTLERQIISVPPLKEIDDLHLRGLHRGQAKTSDEIVEPEFEHVRV